MRHSKRTRHSCAVGGTRRTRGTSRSSTSCAPRTTSTTTRRCRGWARAAARSESERGALGRLPRYRPHHRGDDRRGRPSRDPPTRRGTFKGECLGIPPNNKVIEITGISIHRIANGKLVEHWANADLLSFLQQMGAIPTLEPDTSATH